jgi:crossover junction endodeoxyribonuclease RusA
MIDLLWPPRELHPNSRPHWAAKAKAVKSYRDYAWMRAKESGVIVSPDSVLHLHAVFYPPSKRRYDIDGLLSNIKAGIDGIADGLGINDYAFRSASIEIGNVIKGGGVKIIIKELAQFNQHD